MKPVFIRSSTIRLGIFLSTLIIAVILTFQLIWLKRVYHFEQKGFDLSVIKSVKGLYEDINANAYYSTHLDKLIENPEPHLYIARLELPVNGDSISSYLHYELEDFEIFTNCHIGIYSTAEKKYVYQNTLVSAGNHMKREETLPGTPRDYDHLTLYFPNRQRYIIAQMNSWIISSILLLIVLILFGGSLYYFYKQKFLNETQKDFIHNFTHEFKTPVAVISLAADVLKNPAITAKPDKLATYAGIVKNQSVYLQTQIEKLLRFAQTESRQLHLTTEKADIHELINEAVTNLAPLINERNGQVMLQLDAPNPYLLADRNYLLIVIINLIDNAIKYSKKPDIRISTRNKSNKILLSVADNGTGISPKEIKKIFRKFFRIRNGETYQAKGFGIGLTFVKKIVKAHHGKIKIWSIPDKGSTFTIELPAD